MSESTEVEVNLPFGLLFNIGESAPGPFVPPPPPSAPPAWKWPSGDFLLWAEGDHIILAGE